MYTVQNTQDPQRGRLLRVRTHISYQPQLTVTGAWVPPYGLLVLILPPRFFLCRCSGGYVLTAIFLCSIGWRGSLKLSNTMACMQIGEKCIFPLTFFQVRVSTAVYMNGAPGPTRTWTWSAPSPRSRRPRAPTPWPPPVPIAKLNRYRNAEQRHSCLRDSFSSGLCCMRT